MPSNPIFALLSLSLFGFVTLFNHGEDWGGYIGNQLGLKMNSFLPLSYGVRIPITQGPAWCVIEIRWARTKVCEI
jgi:hypothetical protein